MNGQRDRMKRFAASALAAWTVAAAGQPALPRDVVPDAGPDLPPRAQVERAIAAQPAVRAAVADLEAERARGMRLAAGSYEPLVRGGAQQRRASDPDGRWAEWSVGLERTLRRPGKGELDASIGEQGLRQARAALGEARHEAARALLSDWFAWLRESTAAREWRAQLALVDAQRDAVRRRQRAGDASRLEAEQAEAAWQQTDAQRALADARAAQAAAELTRRHGVAPQDGLEVVPPAPLEGAVRDWVERVLAASHEFAAAREASALALLQARRADAERRPDPTVGVHVGSERGGVERIVGVAVSIPIAGAARAATVDEVAAQARAAGAREAAVRRRLEAEIEGAVLRAAGARDGWKRLLEAAVRLDRVAALSTRAYALGEGTVTEVLVARRLASDARIAAASAGVEAAQARYRLLLDAHRLWDLDDEAPR